MIKRILLVLISIFVFVSLSIALPTLPGKQFCWDTPTDSIDGHWIYWKPKDASIESYNNNDRFKKVGIETSCISAVDAGVGDSEGNVKSEFSYVITAYRLDKESGFSNEVASDPLNIPGVLRIN